MKEALHVQIYTTFDYKTAIGDMMSVLLFKGFL